MQHLLQLNPSIGSNCSLRRGWLSTHRCYVWQWLCPSRLCWCRCHDVISQALRFRPGSLFWVLLLTALLVSLYSWCLPFLLPLKSLTSGLELSASAGGAAPCPPLRRVSRTLLLFESEPQTLLSFLLFFCLLSLKGDLCMAMPEVTFRPLFANKAGRLGAPPYMDSHTVHSVVVDQK